MELSTALIIYVIVTILLFIFFYNVLYLRGWSSFILAIIAGLIILCLYPLTAETLATAIIKQNNLVMVYGVIWFLTALFAFIYLVIKAFSDKRPRENVVEVTGVTYQ